MSRVAPSAAEACGSLSGELGWVGIGCTVHSRMIANPHAGPLEQMKRKLVEKELCEQVAKLPSDAS